jgi:hypothetical protein
LKAKQHQLVMATSQGQVDFVGMNYTAEAAAWQPCSYFIGVFDKEKGSLKLVPLGGEKVPTLLLLSLLLSLAWFFSLGREKDDRRKRSTTKRFDNSFCFCCCQWCSFSPNWCHCSRFSEWSRESEE